MPIDNKLKPILKKHFRKKNKAVEFDIDVEALKVSLVYAPSLKELNKFIPGFCSATWCDKPASGEVFKKLKPKLMDYFFNFKLLPTAFECVNLVFCIEGIEHTTASHLIRHRCFSFSARTHADRDNRDDRYTIPGSIQDSRFNKRYKQIVQYTVELYGDMLDSGEITTMDARAILPRSEQTYYYVKGNLKDFIEFIRVRLDVQTQPQTDNVLAMLLWKEILKIYPQLYKAIDFEQQDKFYINAARTDVGHNLFSPAKKNDIFFYNEKDFIYQKHRDEFIGSKYYIVKKQNIKNAIIKISNKFNKRF